MKKNTHFIGSSKDDLISLPEEVRREVGFALYLAETGDKAVNALPLVGFGSSKVLEIRTESDGLTHRSVYTVKFDKAVYVLHCFTKKSKSGIATPLKEVRLIKRRLKIAQDHYAQHYAVTESMERKNVGKQE